MEKDKKYNIVLGIMIFLFILLIGVCLAWGLGIIGLKSNQVEADNEISNVQNSESGNKVDGSSSSQNNENKVQEITNLEKVSIEEYVGKIYKYAAFAIIPNFDNINDADEEWLWAITFNQLENREMVKKYEIIEKAKELFGDKLNKEPKEDSIMSAYWNEELQYYEGKAHGFMSEEEYRYVISDISKSNNKFNVEIVEYVLNLEEVIKGNENAKVQIKNNDKIIKTVVENQDTTYVKENKELFTSRILEIEEIDGKLHIVSCKNK